MKLAIPAILLVLASLAGATPACAESRVALVIGNASYQHTGALANPGNDAEDMAAALRQVGFTVQFDRDLDKRGMERALAAFARAARDADVVLFYYAGHGLQHRGANYLMPIDARLEDEFSLDFEVTRLDDVLASLSRPKGARILILDACRRNPLIERLAGTSSTRDFVAARGLARLDAPRGMVVAYSTQADQVAIDGTARNSPFTAALVRQLGEPGLEIGPLFRRVAAEVNRTTGGRQLPELSISLLGEFYFNRADSDVQAWAKLRRSEDLVLLRDFINRYPASPLVTDVRERIDAIERLERARIEWERNAREKAEREAAQRQAREREAREQARLAERERLAREDADRLRAEQAERERPAREQAEQGIAQTDAQLRPDEQRVTNEPPARPDAADQQVPSAVTPNAQTALLTPPSEPVPSAPPALTGGALVLELKKELKRVGCYSGRIDEQWPAADTQTALQKFGRIARVPAQEPTMDLLDAVRGSTGRVCPLECGARQMEKDGRCIAKTCPPASELDDAGNCVRRRTANVPPPARAVEPSRAVDFPRGVETNRGGDRAPAGGGSHGARPGEPPPGSIPTGHTVRIDDGSCPRGMVKELTGGSIQHNIPRGRRCVSR